MYLTISSSIKVVLASHESSVVCAINEDNAISTYCKMLSQGDCEQVCYLSGIYHNIDSQDVQVFDIDYMNGKRDFTVDPINFGDLAELVAELHAENIKCIPILVSIVSIQILRYGPILFSFMYSLIFFYTSGFIFYIIMTNSLMCFIASFY